MPENKQELINLALVYFRSLNFRQTMKAPIVFTCKHLSYEITADSAEVLDSCNHQEADTRLVLLAGSHDTPVVVISKDTDVGFISLCCKLVEA